MGQASYDQGIELSGTNHLPTHHIAPTVDLERNAVGADLGKTGLVNEESYGAFTPPIVYARNGRGDYYESDGDVLVINYTTAPIPLQKPAWMIDDLKNGVFSFYDTLFTSLLLAFAAGMLGLALVVWLWLALSWLLKKQAKQIPSCFWHCCMVSDPQASVWIWVLPSRLHPHQSIRPGAPTAFV